MVEIRGKRCRKVPMILIPEAKESIDLSYEVCFLLYENMQFIDVTEFFLIIISAICLII